MTNRVVFRKFPDWGDKATCHIFSYAFWGPKFKVNFFRDSIERSFKQCFKNQMIIESKKLPINNLMVGSMVEPVKSMTL